LLGLGTVGGGTFNVLRRNAEEIARRAGRGIEITHAAAREYDPAGLPDIDSIQVSDDAFALVDNPDIDIIVELIGGYEPARELVLKAIASGKHVVTANKALIATHGNEIFTAAQKQGVMVAFEAAVAGGIPIIKAVREGLTANRIEWIAGIINGTGNFILSEMRDKGRDFADVLAEQFDRVYTEGIGHITREDVNYAGQLGYRIKHLGVTRRTRQGVELRVHPTLIPEKRLIANVDGVMNAVLVQADAVGPTLYYGAGAGAEPTASAVVADLVDVARTMTVDPENRVPHLAFQPDALSDLPILSMDDVETAYYLRLCASDQPGVMADITRILGDSGISIEAVIQKEPPEGEQHVAVIMLTRRVREQQMNAAIQQIESLASVQGTITRIRMEHLGSD
jgi:homoserine dehydrogenase